MRVPISWLREFVELPPDTAEIAQRLALLGFPVAEIERRPLITGVVTGRIAALQRHPNADRLQVAQVEVGAGAPLTIATAATNVAAGQHIAVATIGARLPALTIAPRTMRGIASEGMMISADELGLPAEWFEEGILQLDPATPPGRDAVDLFGLGADVLDVEITTNRPDALSIAGLARELSAAYALPLQLPSYENPGRGCPPGGAPEPSIESADCRRFVLQYADGLAVAPAPAWMRIRLALAGQRPINNLVDVSNYVMLETGQPLHFYDAARVRGGRLVARSAREGERMLTLDGAERRLDAGDLVIADDEGPLCLAGLMGGERAQVGAQSTAITIEAANFNGTRIRRTSGAFALRTEASARHEKSLAPALTEVGAARAASLLQELGARVYEPRRAGEPLHSAPPIELRPSEVERLLGMALPAHRIAEHLRALGCEVRAERADELAVTPPPWRRDLAIAADLIEEVARIEGYDRIPEALPAVPPHEISSAAYEREQQTARALEALGYREIVSLSLRPKGRIAVRNPLSEEARYLRESLLPGMLEFLAGAPEATRIFEIGAIFAARGEEIEERTVAAFAFSAPPDDEPPWRDSRFLQLKGDCELLLRRIAGRDLAIEPAHAADLHPGKTGRLLLDERAVGYAGAVDPATAATAGLRSRAYAAVVELAALPAYRTPQYRPPSKFPSTYRDLALVVATTVSARAVERAIAEHLGALCTGVRVFDEYRGAQVGADRKSLAARITLQRRDATMSDEEADAAIEGLLVALRAELQAEIRR